LEFVGIPNLSPKIPGFWYFVAKIWLVRRNLSRDAKIQPLSLDSDDPSSVKLAGMLPARLRQSWSAGTGILPAPLNSGKTGWNPT